MSAPVALPASTDWTAADLVEKFGPIPLWRIRQHPAPGTATEQDVIDIHDRENRLCELVDAVLVEKTAGIQDSYLAVVIASVLGNFVDKHDLGIVLGTDGMARLAPGLVRIPDASFVSWERLGGDKVPGDAMLKTGPDLAVEVISPSNTKKEMDRKLREYFASDVRLVWYVDPRRRSVEVFTDPEKRTLLQGDQVLNGGDVLPGFRIPLPDLFSKLAEASK